MSWNMTVDPAEHLRAYVRQVAAIRVLDNPEYAEQARGNLFDLFSADLSASAVRSVFRLASSSIGADHPTAIRTTAIHAALRPGQPWSDGLGIEDFVAVFDGDPGSSIPATVVLTGLLLRLDPHGQRFDFANFVQGTAR
jgi:hypothetical protein